MIFFQSYLDVISGCLTPLERSASSLHFSKKSFCWSEYYSEIRSVNIHFNRFKWIRDFRFNLWVCHTHALYYNGDWSIIVQHTGADYMQINIMSNSTGQFSIGTLFHR